MIVAIAISLFIYFAPTLVAIVAGGCLTLTFVINLFLGWTGFGWILAMILAFLPEEN